MTGKKWAKWIVRRGPGGTITLESGLYRHHYLDAHHLGLCHVTYSNYPNGGVKFLWYMEKRSDGAIELRSRRYPNSRLEAYHLFQWARITPLRGYWSKLRIYQPPIRETRQLIATFDNSKGNT